MNGFLIISLKFGGKIKKIGRVWTSIFRKYDAYRLYSIVDQSPRPSPNGVSITPLELKFDLSIPNLNQRRALGGLQKSLSQNWFHQKLTQNSLIWKTHLYKKATRVRNLFSDVGRSKVAPLRWKFTRNELRSVLAVKEVMQLNLFAKYAENTRVSLIWENRQLLWSFSNHKFQDRGVTSLISNREFISLENNFCC